MIQGFAHPAIAVGALLAVVPLIIHLLNRRRHKPLRWGAMRFVEAAYKRTRRRMQMENLLLLLLRMAAVALLAFAVARPLANRGALGALTEASRDMVLMVDGSASMGYREDIDTVFDRAVRRAEALVGELDPGRGDRVHVLLLGREARLIAWPTPEQALSVLNTLDQPLFEPMNLDAAFGELERLVQEGEILDIANTDVRLLTDLQRASFVDSAEEGEPPAYLTRLDTLESQGLRVTVEDLGPAAATPPNVGVHSLALHGGVRGPKEVSVVVHNHANLPQPGVRVSLELDGNRLPSQRIDLEPQSPGQALFSLGDLEAGPHRLLASIEGDRLAVDDTRAAVALIPEPTRVLLVNGSPADDLERDGVGYLRLALEQDASGDAPSPFHVTELRAGELAASDLDFTQFEVLWLAGTPPPNAEVVEKLENAVLQGAALVFSSGPLLGDATQQNQRLFRADGSGLLPGEWLGRVSIARQGDFYRVGTFDEGHPALEVFSDTNLKPLLIGVPFSDFTAFAPEPGARILASFDDQGQHPLLVEKKLGRGRVMVWTSSINEEWTLLPRAGRTFVPLVYEWLTYAAQSRIEDRAIRPGEPVNIEVQGFPRNPELERPDGSRRYLEDDPFAVGAETYRLPPLVESDTRQIGLYQIHLEGAPAQPFAVVLDPQESQLARLQGGELAGLHPALRISDATESTPGSIQDPREGEIWRWLAILALVCLVGESLWGAWLGRKRSVTA